MPGGSSSSTTKGMHVPLVIAGPTIEPGQVRDDLVEHIDIAALSLALAGIEIPETHARARHPQPEDYQKRTAIFAARDRCDETVDYIRALRTTRFKYIRNFLPNRPHLQPNLYKDGKSIVVALREAHAAGTLNETQQLLFAPTRPAEELYDLSDDPFEVRNLAGDPKHQAQLKKLRKRMDDWIERTNDHGAESAAMYDSEMAAYSSAREREPRIGCHPQPQHRPDEALGGRGQVAAQSNRPLGEVFAPVKSGPSSRQPLKIFSPIRRANRGSSA